MLMVVKVREHSWVARLAAKKLRAKRVAMVLGNTIHLFNATKEELLENKAWLRHELVHVNQFAHYGYFPFMFYYLLESIKKGYYKNRFEIEARSKENDDSLLKNVIIV